MSRAFVELADTLVDEYDVIDVLDRLVGHCVELLAVDAAGIMLSDAQHQLRVVASSSEDVESMDLLQVRAEQGPHVDCLHTGQAVSVPRVSEEGARWPRFVAAVAAKGTFESVHALPLHLRGQAIGVLNLWHREPGALPAEDLALAQALADVATIGILSAQAIHRHEVFIEQLQTTLNSRVIVEQAKGVLAQYGGVSADVAFARLRQYARDHRRPLVDVARQLADTTLPAERVLAAQAGPSPADHRR